MEDCACLKVRRVFQRVEEKGMNFEFALGHSNDGPFFDIAYLKEHSRAGAQNSKRVSQNYRSHKVQEFKAF